MVDKDYMAQSKLHHVQFRNIIVFSILFLIHFQHFDEKESKRVQNC